jgi:hypothetical protein
MKKTVLTLIQLDLKHTRFIEHLNAAGLTADQYYLNLSTVIFELLQLDRSTPEKADALQEGYFRLILQTINLRSDNQKIEIEAEVIHKFLTSSI